MALGNLRITGIVPAQSLGRWGQDANGLFGGTVVDLTVPAGALTLVSASAIITNAVGVVTTEPVYAAAAFVAPWTAVGSSWVAGTGVLRMQRTGGVAAGSMIRFKLRLRDAAANDSYVSWYTGSGDAPGSEPPPAVGRVVKTADGALWKISGIVGTVGSRRYRCVPNLRTRGGVALLGANEFTLVGPRDKLSESILVEE